jgi:hypothetical protein
MDRSIGGPPPFVVVVQGPPQVSLLGLLAQTDLSPVSYHCFTSKFSGGEVVVDKMSSKTLYQTKSL